MMAFFVVAVVCLFICGLLGKAVAGEEEARFGFWLGFLLGPIGVVVAAVVGSRAKQAIQKPRHKPSQTRWYDAEHVSAADAEMEDQIALEALDALEDE